MLDAPPADGGKLRGVEWPGRLTTNLARPRGDEGGDLLNHQRGRHTEMAVPTEPEDVQPVVLFACATRGKAVAIGA
jgi:hypothetical protein